MSVYTEIQKKDLEPFTRARALGPPNHLEGIAQGVINSNYRLTTNQGTFILTLIENPLEVESLPFVIPLLETLAQQGFPVPRPIKDHHNNQAIFTLAGRPAVIVTQLPGISPDPPNPDQCQQLGSWLGRIHNTTIPETTCSDPMGSHQWELMIDRLGNHPGPIDQEVVAMLTAELTWLKHHWLHLRLPTGLCHCDLFPDNTLFHNNLLTGIIDFYSACHGTLLYDLAICLCSWCLDDTGQPHPDRIQALLEGYDSVRPRHHDEHENLTKACRAAAFRFSLSRFHDHCFPRSGTKVTRRNPESFLARLRFLQSTPLPGVVPP